MARLYGRALRSERCICHVPHGHWHTNTFIAGIRTSGMCAPWLLDGPMNADCFQVYVENILIPELSPGDTVICDNLSCHRGEGIRKAVESCGASIRYLPPYSPDLNPIEQMFAKLKALMRKYSAREAEDLFKGLAEVIKHISAADCREFIRHAQYASN